MRLTSCTQCLVGGKAASSNCKDYVEFATVLETVGLSAEAIKDFLFFGDEKWLLQFTTRQAISDFKIEPTGILLI